MNPLKTGDELGDTAMICSSCSTSRTRHVNHVKNLMTSHFRSCDYDKLNISVVICDTDIPFVTVNQVTMVTMQRVYNIVVLSLIPYRGY